MWAALHWIEHDKAGEIDMKFIFDQCRSLPHGIADGGMGKSEMYKNRRKELREVEFSCKPFNKLFWRLWGLFSGHNWQRWIASAELRGGSKFDRDLDGDPGSGADSASIPEPSVSPEKMIQLFEAALKLQGWTDDKVEDQFPRTSSVATSRMALQKMDNVDDRAGPNQKKRWASKSLGHDPESEVLIKRQKLE